MMHTSNELDRRETSPPSSWWHNLYDDLLADMLLVRGDPSELRTTVGFILEQLALAKGHRDRVFDQCCGIGSVAIEIARAGMHVVGVEQSAAYVERGLAMAREQGVESRIDLIAGDARDHVPSAPVNGAFNWWTSFGYSESDPDNARMLARAFDALEPGGVFLLDTMNLPNVFRTFEEETMTRRSTPRGEIVLRRSSRIDAAAGVMRKRWSYVLPDGQLVEKPESIVRLYMPHTLAEMLMGVGFEEISFFGSVRGEPLGIDSGRCICRARKPKANGRST